MAEPVDKTPKIITPLDAPKPTPKERFIRILKIALPIIGIVALTAGMIACSIYAPIPFLCIVVGAGTLSFFHLFTIRRAASKFNKFLENEIKRLQSGQGPSVTAEELSLMIKAARFNSILSKIMVAINAIFLVSPLSMMNYKDYTLIDKLMPSLQCYQKQLAIPKDTLNKDYIRHTQSMLFLASKKFYQLPVKNDDKPILKRLAVIEELEDDLFYTEETCPGELKEQIQELADLQKDYRAHLSRSKKKALVDLLVVPSIPAETKESVVKKLEERITNYADKYVKELDMKNEKPPAGPQKGCFARMKEVVFYRFP